MLLRLYCDDGEHEHGTEYFEFYDGKFIVKCRNGYIKEYANVKAIMCKDVTVFSLLEYKTGLPVELLIANCEEAMIEHREKHPEKWNIRSRDDGKQ